MTAKPIFTTYWPVALVTVVHILAVGVLYGTLTTEIQVLNKSMIEVVRELKHTNQSIHDLKEKDIRLELIQESVKYRIERLESKHP
jgi:hypothetical protein